MKRHYSRRRFYLHQGRYYEVNVGRLINESEGELEICTNYMKKILDVFTYHLEKHKRLFVMRIDLVDEALTNSNKHYSKFLKGLVAHLERYYKVKIGYAWCREIGSDMGLSHYHLALFISARVVKYHQHITEEIKHRWHGPFETPAYGYVNILKNPFRIVKISQLADSQENCRHDPLGLLIYRISYMAKKSTKAPSRMTRSFGTSYIAKSP